MHGRFSNMAILTALILSTLFVQVSGDRQPSVRMMPVDAGPSRSPPDPNVTGGLYDGLVRYDDVALIVNDNSEMSKEIGTYFAMKRGLPSLNIINISVDEKEIIDFAEYDDLARQVKENLSERGLTNKINYLVTTKGVPLKVTSGETNMNRQQYYESASVDSELMLLDSDDEYLVHNLWTVDNPYAGSGEPFSREVFGIRLVTRLTGYTVEEAKGLVDKATVSFGVRGNALLDMDPGKNGSGGYKQGNDWMLYADNWLKDNGYPSYLDATRDFRTGWTDTMAYYSWGSNDGDWGEVQSSNTGFEYGTDAQASSWIYEAVGGTIERTEETSASGSWSLKMARTGSGIIKAYQDVPVNYPDHRFIADGRMSISGVGSPGARILLEGYDMSGKLRWTHELANRTGTRNFDYYQDPIENDTTVTTIRMICELLGDGTAFFDNFYLRVIRPHNQWLNGSIAETIVSTGGRSITYGTWYGQSLVADLIRDGVTGIKGYTWEPFITAVSRAHILIPAYYLGFSLAESFWMGSPYVSWMGTVIGDPKCTPFINERPDMGPSPDEDPIRTWVDEYGTPWLSFNLKNKGNRNVEQGVVELYIDGVAKIHEELVDLAPNGTYNISISSTDQPEIFGSHVFTMKLDPGDEIMEYDEYNNNIEVELSVNQLPNLDLWTSEDEVSRTSTKVLELNLADPDGDLSLDNLDIYIEDPSKDRIEPEIDVTFDDGNFLTADVLLTPGWDAKLGFYSVRALYTDPNGSWSGKDLIASFKVVNAQPEITGELHPQEASRGSVVFLNVTWQDPDTPQEPLTVSGSAESALGGDLEPVSVDVIDSNNASLMFILPPEELSQTWTFVAMVLDRDGGKDAWTGTLRSVNRAPSAELLEVVYDNITRLMSNNIFLKYSDPEGQRSDMFRVTISGPVNSPSNLVIYDEEYTLSSGEELMVSIPGSGLGLGSYSLTVKYRDDEGLGSTLSVPSVFDVINIPPELMEVTITHSSGERMPVEVMRGDALTITASVRDQDSTGSQMQVEGKLVSNLTGTQQDVLFDQRGEGTFLGRLTTDIGWLLGSYDLQISVTDRDGAVVMEMLQEVMVLDADKPFVLSAEVFVDLNLTAEAEVILGTGLGSTSPGTVFITLYDGNGTFVGESLLLLDQTGNIWSAVFDVSGEPVSGNIAITDDLGRTAFFNSSVQIDVEEKPADPQGTGGSGGGSTDLILLLIVAVLALLIVLIMAVISFLLLRRRSESAMMPAPPMALSGPGGVPLMGPSSAQSLPPSGGGAKPALPPGRELQDGSSYHKPEELPMAPAPVQSAPPPGQSPPEKEGDSDRAAAEPSNTGSVVEPPEQDVRHTDDPNIPGDPGQGEQEGQKGPDLGPGLPVQDAEAEPQQG
ncbi:MAG: TIGR03790 family protein [Thermoplasmatota archaeon]